jgi:hypothetical protein
MSGNSDQQLGGDQVVQILADCIPRSGGNNNQVQMSNTLQFYGLDIQAQVEVLKSWIIGNSSYGVPAYKFHLSGDALNFATPSTSLSDIADVIQNRATPMVSGLAGNTRTDDP